MMTDEYVINRVILCCYGDSYSPDYWSNVPFLLGKAFESNGQSLTRLDLRPRLLEKIWSRLLLPLHVWLEPSTSYNFFRSFTNWLWVSFRLSCICLHYGKRGTIIVICHLSFAPWFSTVPVVLLGDWCYDKYIRYFLKRRPNFFESQVIRRDHAALKRSSLIVSIFPGAALYINRLYPDVVCHYLGHAVNRHPDAPPCAVNASRLDRSEAITCESIINLLFVGGKKYLEGAELLLEALATMPLSRFHLHVIGLDAADIGDSRYDQLPVSFYGYLSKGDLQQRVNYYAVLDLADIIVNASVVWGPFSATIEAMSRFTAVLTPAYDEFVEMFGSDLSFGSYLESLSPRALVDAILDLSSNADSLTEAKSHAATAVKDFRYSTFVQKVCDLVAMGCLPQA